MEMQRTDTWTGFNCLHALLQILATTFLVLKGILEKGVILMVIILPPPRPSLAEQWLCATKSQLRLSPAECSTRRALQGQYILSAPYCQLLSAQLQLWGSAEPPDPSWLWPVRPALLCLASRFLWDPLTATSSLLLLPTPRSI